MYLHQKHPPYLARKTFPISGLSSENVRRETFFLRDKIVYTSEATLLISQEKLPLYAVCLLRMYVGKRFS